jgi:hypothetical protein
LKANGFRSFLFRPADEVRTISFREGLLLDTDRFTRTSLSVSSQEPVRKSYDHKRLVRRISTSASDLASPNKISNQDSNGTAFSCDRSLNVLND